MPVAGPAFHRAFNDIALHRLPGNADDGKAMTLNMHFAPAVLSTVCRRVDAPYFHPKTLDAALPNIRDCFVQRFVRGATLCVCQF